MIAASSHGEVVWLHELAAQPREFHGASVRVFGRVTSVDLAAERAVIAHDNSTLCVLTSQLPADGPVRVGRVCQFIGECIPGLDAQSPLELQARVVRAFDDVDVALYVQTIELRRQFLAND